MTATESAPGGALSGVRVADFTAAAAGPYCTMLLADMGADVVKVEPPVVGDHARGWGDWHIDNRSFLFLAVNRNKRSVAMNLKTKEGQELAHRLIATSDVVVENLAPGGAEKLGIGYDAVARTNPHAVYLSISGFGRTGPLKDELGFDMMLQAYTGILDMTGEPDRPPVRVPISALDLMTGSLGAMAILAALRERDISGRGQRVEASLYETAINCLLHAVPSVSATGKDPQRMGGEFSALFPYGIFQAKDDPFYLGIAIDAAWQRWCAAAGWNDLGDDPRFATNGQRVLARDELREIIADRLVEEPVETWLEVGSNARVPVVRINTVSQAISDDHASVREAVVPVPGVEGVSMAGIPIKMDRGVGGIWGEPPKLGLNTREVLGSLGVTDQELERLSAAGTVQTNE